MNINLLYPDREWVSPEYYYDEKSITMDLGLDSLFSIAGKECLYRMGEVYKVGECDLFIKSTMQRVMLTPLKTEEEILYRQDIVKDVIKNESLIRALYGTSSRTLDIWDKMGRRLNSKNTGRDNATKLISRIGEFRLFLDSLSTIRKAFEDPQVKLQSEGLKAFYERFCRSFSLELEENLRRVSSSLEFYANNTKGSSCNPTVQKPRIVLECGIGEGCKYTGFELKEISTVEKKYRDPKSTVAKVQGFINSLTPDSVSCNSDINAEKQTARLEYEVANYMMSFVEPFMSEFEYFFDKLHFQSAFYMGADYLHHHFKRFSITYGYPTVGPKDRLAFDELKEFVMCIEQKINAVGNTCEIEPKNLIIITGANQGGKSTFLRSIGIAQVMMQCGLMVAARHFESGIFPSLFMHFTRREDSEMNSGRLDEELNRMNQIINNLGPDSLILLNESFATTTEKDGSAIAYDIIKALKEAGVKIITVTHLLSFAQKVHEECEEIKARGEETGVEFFCAERKANGLRTYKMIASVPELTSFGLDLYENIIEK